MYKVIGFLVMQISVVNSFAQAVVLDNNTTTTQSKIAKDWYAYTHPDENITVIYPQNWTLKTTNEKTIFVLKSPLENEKDKFNENINMVVKMMPAEAQKITLVELKDAIEGKLPSTLDNFLIRYTKDVSWNGYDSKEISYEGLSKTDSTAVYFIQRYTLIQGRFILATYTAEGNKTDIYKATGEKIMNNVVFNLK